MAFLLSLYQYAPSQRSQVRPSDHYMKCKKKFSMVPLTVASDKRKKEGAQNPWSRQGCNKIETFDVPTSNSRTLLNQEKLSELENRAGEIHSYHSSGFPNFSIVQPVWLNRRQTILYNFSQSLYQVIILLSSRYILIISVHAKVSTNGAKFTKLTLRYIFVCYVLVEFLKWSFSLLYSRFIWIFFTRNMSTMPFEEEKSHIFFIQLPDQLLS